jgi:hypothetical protein
VTDAQPMIVDVLAYPSTEGDAGAPSTYTVLLSEVQHITVYRNQYGESEYRVYLREPIAATELSTQRHRGQTDSLYLPAHHPFIDRVPHWVHITRATRREYL